MQSHRYRRSNEITKAYKDITHLIIPVQTSKAIDIAGLMRSPKPSKIQIFNFCDWFCCKCLPTLAQIMLGTKYDRDKTIFDAEKGGKWDLTGLEKGDPTWSKGVKNGGQSGRNSLPPSSMGVPPSLPAWLSDIKRKTKSYLRQIKVYTSATTVLII